MANRFICKDAPEKAIGQPHIVMVRKQKYQKAMYVQRIRYEDKKSKKMRVSSSQGTRFFFIRSFLSRVPSI